MTNTLIESKSGLSLGVWICGAAGISLAVLAVVFRSMDWAVGAVLPMVLCVTFMMRSAHGVTFEITSQGLALLHEAAPIPFESMYGVWTSERLPGKPVPHRFGMELIHEGGSLFIPRDLNVESEQVYAAITTQIPESSPREINDLLSDYLERHTTTFGTDRVWAYSARRHLGRGRAWPGARTFFAAMFWTGLVWIPTRFVLKVSDAWTVMGIILAITGGLFYIAFRFDRRRPGIVGKKWTQASLVICPAGLALVQGDIKGELRWDELRNVKLHVARSSMYLSSGTIGPHIELVVEGSSIHVADIYDRPLPRIHDRILQYWRSPRG